MNYLFITKNKFERNPSIELQKHEIFHRNQTIFLNDLKSKYYEKLLLKTSQNFYKKMLFTDINILTN